MQSSGATEARIFEKHGVDEKTEAENAGAAKERRRRSIQALEEIRINKAEKDGKPDAKALTDGARKIAEVFLGVITIEERTPLNRTVKDELLAHVPMLGKISGYADPMRLKTAIMDALYEANLRVKASNAQGRLGAGTREQRQIQFKTLLEGYDSEKFLEHKREQMERDGGDDADVYDSDLYGVEQATGSQTFKCSVTISVPFGHFGVVRLKGYAKRLHKLTLFEIP